MLYSCFGLETSCSFISALGKWFYSPRGLLCLVQFGVGGAASTVPLSFLSSLPGRVPSDLSHSGMADAVLKPSGPWSYSLAFSLTLDPPSSLTKFTGHLDVGLCILLVKSSYRQEPRLSVCGLYSKTYIHFTGTYWYCTGARCPLSQAFLIF